MVVVAGRSVLHSIGENVRRSSRTVICPLVVMIFLGFKEAVWWMRSRVDAKICADAARAGDHYRDRPPTTHIINHASISPNYSKRSNLKFVDAEASTAYTEPMKAASVCALAERRN